MATGQQDGCIWSLVIKKKRVGPLTEQEVRDRCTQGQITQRTYTWRKGMKKWIRLGDVPEFYDLLLSADSSESMPAPSPEEEVTPVKTKKTSTRPMFQITSPEDVDAVTLGAAATMPAGGSDTVVDPRDQEDRSSQTGRWDGSAPSIPADASVPVVEAIPVEEPSEEPVVELTGGIDPNAATTRWDQEQVDQAISDLTSGQDRSPEAANSTSQEIRMEGDLNQLFGREPSVPAATPATVTFEPPHKPEVSVPPLEVEDQGEQEPYEQEMYEQQIPADDEEYDEEDEEEDDEEDDEEYEEEYEDEDEEDEEVEDEDEDDDDEPLAALAAQSKGPEPDGGYSMGEGLVGARAKDSVLFSRTQFDTLASSMRGESPPLDEDDEGYGLHDIQPLADQALSGARDEDSVLFSRAALAGMTDGLEEAERDDSSSLIDIKPLASTYMTAGIDPALGPDLGPLPSAPPASPLLFSMEEEEKRKHGLGTIVFISVVGVLATLALLVGGLYLARPDLVKAFFAGPASEQTARETGAAKETQSGSAGDDEKVAVGGAEDTPEPAVEPGEDKDAPAARAAKPRGKRAAKKTPTTRAAQRKPAPREEAKPALVSKPRPTPRTVAPTPRPVPRSAPGKAKGDELDDLINTALGDEKKAKPKAAPLPRAEPAPASEPVDEDLPESLSRDQIRKGMTRANIGVQACRSSLSYGGTVTIQVTVSGRTGRIVTATALGSFRDTAGGKCVAASAKFAARFPRFSGANMTFQYPYIIR